MNVTGTMDDLLSLASRVRERYLDAWRSVCVDCRSAHSPVALELLLELRPEEFRPAGYYRVDLAYHVAGKPKLVDVDPAAYLEFLPLEVALDPEVVVEIQPFVWNSVSIRVDRRFAAAPIEAWAVRWLDLEDSFPLDEFGFQGVIHAIQRTETSDLQTELSIDFGSAPVAALQELLQLILRIGATRLRIHSDDLS